VCVCTRLSCRSRLPLASVLLVVRPLRAFFPLRSTFNFDSPLSYSREQRTCFEYFTRARKTASEKPRFLLYTSRRARVYICIFYTRTRKRVLENTYAFPICHTGKSASPIFFPLEPYETHAITITTRIYGFFSFYRNFKIRRRYIITIRTRYSNARSR